MPMLEHVLRSLVMKLHTLLMVCLFVTFKMLDRYFDAAQFYPYDETVARNIKSKDEAFHMCI